MSCATRGLLYALWIFEYSTIVLCRKLAKKIIGVWAAKWINNKMSLVRCHCFAFKIYSFIYRFIYLQDAQLSQRDRAAGCVIVFAKSRTLELGDYILRTLYIYLQPLWYNRPENLSNSLKKTQNKGYYGVQDHSRSSRSVPIETRMRFPISD